MPSSEDPKKSLRLGKTDWEVQEAAAKAAGLTWGDVARETLARHFVDVAAELAAGGERTVDRARAPRRRSDRPRVRITKIAAERWGVTDEIARRRIAAGKVLLDGAPVTTSMIDEDRLEDLEWV